MSQDLKQRIDIGRQAFDRREYAEALGVFREILAANPGYADLRHLSGLCLSFLGQPEAALAEFDQAVALNSRYVEAHLNRAITLNELGRFDEARLAFDAAAQLEIEGAGQFPVLISAKLANAHATVGDLYLEAGAPTQAVQEFRTALKMRPLFHDIRNKLAEALLQLGEFDAAAHELETVLRGNGRFLAARLNLGLVRYKQGRHADAQREWETCREQQPENPQVRAYFAMLDRNAFAGPPASPDDPSPP